MPQPSTPSPERRSFFTRLTGAATLTALAFGGRALAQTKAAPGHFEPARHDQDDWMDQIAGKHRLVFDTINNEGIGNALMFANNFLIANRNSYGLENNDLAVIIVARHLSTGFGFTDAIWARYGTQIASMSSIAAAKSNTRMNGEMGIEELAKKGVHFAVCAMATTRLAGSIAKATGAATADINAELTSNLVPNARMVPAGIVAVSRAQERGYTLVTA
jgi:intracellular sulfur oxidation DsrE/DsrF family protein